MASLASLMCRTGTLSADIHKLIRTTIQAMLHNLKMWCQAYAHAITASVRTSLIFLLLSSFLHHSRLCGTHFKIAIVEAANGRTASARFHACKPKTTVLKLAISPRPAYLSEVQSSTVRIHFP